jgi:hypothetical protein
MELSWAMAEPDLTGETEAMPDAGPCAELGAEADRELAGNLRGKLNLAVSLACRAEQARRAKSWASAAAFQQQWEETIEEVRQLLPLVGKGDRSLFGTRKGRLSRSHRKRR